MCQLGKATESAILFIYLPIALLWKVEMWKSLLEVKRK